MITEKAIFVSLFSTLDVLSSLIRVLLFAIPSASFYFKFLGEYNVNEFGLIFISHCTWQKDSNNQTHHNQS